MIVRAFGFVMVRELEFVMVGALEFVIVGTEWVMVREPETPLLSASGRPYEVEAP